MIKIKHLLIVGSTLFTLNATSLLQYSIQPHFNENTKELTIDTLSFKNATLVNKHQAYDKNKVHSFKRLKESYKLKSPQCKKLRYSLMENGDSTYITSDLESMLKEKSIKENTNCKITKLANLVMHNCIDLQEKSRFYISSSIKGNNGGFSKREYIMLDQQCFTTLKKHYQNKAKKDNLSITHTNLAKDTVLDFEWEQNSKKIGEVSFIQAKNHCKTLTLNGFTNWRLPTKEEYYATPNALFKTTEDDLIYWTSSPHYKDEDIIWMHSLPYYASSSGYYNKQETKGYVNCVRDKIKK